LTFKKVKCQKCVKNPGVKVDNNKRCESRNDSRFTKNDFKIWLITTNMVKLQNSEMGRKKIVEFPWLIYI
jgi:hypothetical protein